MTRKCSHCSNNGHNSRTCPTNNKVVKLFGVRLDAGGSSSPSSSSMRKSVSMCNLTTLSNNGSFQNLTNLVGNHDSSPGGGDGHINDGYASEDYVKGSSSSCRERKKGVAWTEEEHKMFLLGLQKLGKGDWRGISRSYVITRTPTQVASHAQKYFIRQCNMSRRKRRSSLFDMVADESADAPQVGSALPDHPQAETENINLSTTPTLDEECESMDSTNPTEKQSVLVQHPVPMPIMPMMQSSYPVMCPPFYYPYFPYPVPVWPGYGTGQTATEETHEVVKPMATHMKSPMNVEQLGLMSKLTLGESVDKKEQSLSTSLSLQTPGESSSRQSAFHQGQTYVRAIPGCSPG
ncbi:hypothetical protein MKW94_024507 [Papaver nudicaule]|uniref:Uncharacterized protein n=1 Tax=Papaver nudicaule TaxID=74823 RepID=A0AA41SJ71_PAPNU|nr:hypothetical protein [Papaver nudicaule]